ncbi:MAG TPA: hypothetical protein VFL64_09895 [Rhizobacter sp.]|nr:hypothetical protein [Rhizobacter sp.]
MTPEELAREARAVEQDARRALDGSQLMLPREARVGTPVPVRALAGRLESWFVPVLAGDWLVAYLRFSPLRMLRASSSFMRHTGDMSECPLAADWLDVELIRERAEDCAHFDETAGEPMLSFDGAPDRLAWAVPLQRAGVTGRWLFVAGEAVWPALP